MTLRIMGQYSHTGARDVSMHQCLLSCHADAIAAAAILQTVQLCMSSGGFSIQPDVLQAHMAAMEASGLPSPQAVEVGGPLLCVVTGVGA